MKNVILVYNPISGERVVPGQLDAIIHLYQKAGFLITTIRISRDLGFTPLIELNRQLTIDHIVISGGDGSVNRLVNFLKANNIDLPLGILPAGTANDFAMMLGMPKNILAAARAIISGRVERLDLGMVGDQYFVNIFSCGLFTDISQKTPTRLKNTFGRVAYYFGTISELPNFRKLNINLTSPELSYTGQCLLFMVFNGRTAGNLPLARLSNANDGLFDVFIIKGTNIAQTIGTLSHFLLLRKDVAYPSDVVYFQTNRLSISIEESNIPTDIDGETGPQPPFQIECIPQSIRIIVPQQEEPQN